MVHPDNGAHLWQGKAKVLRHVLAPQGAPDQPQQEIGKTKKVRVSLQNLDIIETDLVKYIFLQQKGI